ncbi:Chaperone dnaJ 49 protein [Rutstroemia sp. NJR-2017a BVV2]|nr:Chaperone dnaJ 49 protein [Rutstroemia sp. NJR-2017a BVV2]
MGRLAFAFEILKSPSSRATYDRVARPTTDALPTKTSFLGADHTFLSAVSSLLHDFITGDFILIRSFLLSLHTQYPNLVNKDIMTQVETGFWRTREIVMWGRGWALIVLGEMGRVAKVQRQLGELGRWDVVGRVRGMVRLVRVVVAVPVRVDRKVRERGEKEWRARRAGLEARGEAEVEEWRRGGILNERVFKVLEFIVGEAGRDEEEDRAGQGVRTWM